MKVTTILSLCFFFSFLSSADPNAHLQKEWVNSEYLATYYYGMGFNELLRNNTKAIQWFMKSAELGDARSQFALGEMYDNGKGVLQDYELAVQWCTKAAKKGEATAQYRLGLMYGLGHGMRKDTVTAYSWANIAAANGKSPKLRELLAKEMTTRQITEGQKLSREMVKANPKLHGTENSIETTIATKPVLGKEYTIVDLDLEMIWVGNGTYIMGSSSSEELRFDNEVQHHVTLTNAFWLGKYEVTQSQWRKVMGTNPSHFIGNDLPVEQVSWEDAIAFCRKLNKIDDNKPRGYTYNLPTEAQWEYACRAGTTTSTAYGNTLSSRYGNFVQSFEKGAKFPFVGMTTAVGSYFPNPWGFYDMHGNVWEWCHDWHGNYEGGRVTDPAGLSSGTDRVRRGGCWLDHGRHARSASRGKSPPDRRVNLFGFRLSLQPG